MTALDVVPVHIPGWEFECCGKPFAIGDEVTWTLLFATQLEATHPEQEIIEAGFQIADIQPDPPGPPEDGTIVSIGRRVLAWMPGDVPAPGRVALQGALIYNHHGGVPFDTPATRGVVKRIRVITEDYRLVASPRHTMMEPIIGSIRYRDVTRTPARFDEHPSATGAVQSEDSGLLVDLELLSAEQPLHESATGTGRR